MIRSGQATATADLKDHPGDYVTDVDRRSERVIGEILQAGAPGIRVVGEERGGEEAGRYWLVDPLDGTTNFLHRFHDVGVSIALIEDGRPVVGAVHGPFLGETYYGASGMGARHVGSDAPLRTSDRAPDRAVVATGFPFRVKEMIPRYLPVFEQCLHRFEDLRRPGAAALDLAWVAAGVFDGFFELNLGSWDVAAGALLIREAGGVVTDWDGHPDRWLDTGHILAGNPAVHATLLELAARSPASEA